MKVLGSLDVAIAKYYPRRFAGFGKPAAKKSVDALEKGFGRALPASVRALFAAHSDAPGLLVEKRDAAQDLGWDLDDPATVLDAYRTWCRAKRPAKEWKASWLPLFGNGAGDNICLDVETGKLVEVLHEEPRRRVYATSLDAGLAYVLARVKAGRWGGSHESKVVTKLIRGVETFDPLKSKVRLDTVLTSNDMYRLRTTDPASALVVLDAAEKRLDGDGWWTHAQDYIASCRATVLNYRVQIYAALENREAALVAYRALLALMRTFGSLWGDFERVIGALDKLGARDAFIEAVEIEQAAAQQIELEDDFQGTTPLVAWLGANTFKMARLRKQEMKKVVDSMVTGAKVATGVELARCHVMRAAALRELGNKPASTSAWKAATSADTKTAAFWRSHSLLAPLA